LLPYFSRRIGLVDDKEVPLIVGAKVNGRVGANSFAGLAVGTDEEIGVVDQKVGMAVGRVKRNLWRESWVGAIATVGDPLGREGSWLTGMDFTYATSRFRGDKNLLVGVWGLATGREDLHHDRTAFGLKIDYPNDLWDIAVISKRIGRDFDPSLGFVPRRAVFLHQAGADFSPRLEDGPVQQMFFEFNTSLATDLNGRWESYRVFIAPVNWRFRSGDRFEFNVNPTGERLTEPFEVSPGVVIAPETYQWRQYRFEAGTAQKRRFYTQLTWWFGGFYDGTIDQYEWTGAWNPNGPPTDSASARAFLSGSPMLSYWCEIAALDLNSVIDRARTLMAGCDPWPPRPRRLRRSPLRCTARRNLAVLCYG